MDNIKCPHCNKFFPISDAIRHELEEKVKTEQTEKLKAQFKKDLEKEQAETEKRLRKQFEEDTKGKASELEEFKRKEKILAEKLAQVEEEKEKEAEKIKAEANKAAEENQELKIKELNIQMAQILKANEEIRRANEDLKRKVEQGSQQMQGEALELNLEEKLRKAFPYDEFTPVPKGIEGGDIIQNVRNKFGKTASTIIWEFKRTKIWNKNWLSKLREDARSANANECIIVSEVLPEGVKVYEKIDGVWVTGKQYALPLAFILREMGLRIAVAKSAASHDDASLKLIHDYILSEKFRHKIEKDVETVDRAIKNLEAKHKVDEKYYRLQKTNLEVLSDNTSQIYFDLQEILPALPSIAGLEPALEDIDENENQTLL